VADPRLVASFFTLTGSGFAEPPRHGFAQRCRAASDAGFAGIGLHTGDPARTDVDGMRAVLADTGLELVEIEFLGGWALDVDEPALEASVTAIEAVAGAFGGRHVSAGEFRGGRLDLDAAAERLAALAARLAPLLLAVEPFPWSALPDAGTAVELLRRAGAPNAGLMVDVWHFWNGGADLDLLTGPPAAVQLNDGPLVHEDFLRHARAARMLPGEGDLDVTGLVRAVHATGFDGPWCVEVNTPDFRALPVDEAAKRAVAAATAVLDAALG
jgi:sugar phosphate isomerase/epimerase